MKKDVRKTSSEDLKKKYISLIKKISTEDLRDLLTILYSEPALVINNPDFEKLEQGEKEFYAKDSARIAFSGEHRREDLISKLDNGFHIFDEEVIPSPFLDISTFPKASLLIGVVKSTLNLRENGKELPDDERITLIECFTSDHSKNDYKIAFNEDYLHPLKVSKNTKAKVWGFFIELIENGYLEGNRETKQLYDYLNFHPDNRITKNTKFPLQVIIGQRDGGYVPLFKFAVHSDKTLVQRQNKLKSST